MATNIETIWVSSPDQLNATVQTYIGQGGQVQNQAEGEVVVFLKKKMNVAVLIVGLLLCVVPGLAYLIWYSSADQSQQITVKIGVPGNITTGQEHWYNEEAIDGASPGTIPPAIPPAAPGAPAVPAAPAVGALPATAPIPPSPVEPAPVQNDMPPLPPGPPAAPEPPIA